MLWDSLHLLAIVALLTGLMGEGYLPPKLLAGLLIAIAFFRALSRAVGGVTVRLYILFYGFFYGILAIFVIFKGNLKQAPSLLLTALANGFEKLLLQVLNLIIQGDLSIWPGLLAILAMVFIRKLAWELASRVLYRVFGILGPLLSLLIMIMLLGEGEFRQSILVGGAVLGLFLIAEAFYFLAFGFASGLKRSDGR